jgi:hypothetical protein
LGASGLSARFELLESCCSGLSARSETARIMLFGFERGSELLESCCSGLNASSEQLES